MKIYHMTIDMQSFQKVAFLLRKSVHINVLEGKVTSWLILSLGWI